MKESKKNLVEKWYVLHTYSGHEYKVQKSLEERAVNLGVKDQIVSILVPDEEKIEVRRNKRKIVQKKCFPGYVLVKILVEPIESKLGLEYKMDNNVWYVIRNTDGVSGFVSSGFFPTPLSNEEIDAIQDRMKRYSEVAVDVKVKEGDMVEIIRGSFMGSHGKISSIDIEHLKLTVMVDMFGRSTPIEVNFDEVKPV